MVILAASVFDLSAEKNKTDRQTIAGGKTTPRVCHRRWQTFTNFFISHHLIFLSPKYQSNARPIYSSPTRYHLGLRPSVLLTKLQLHVALTWFKISPKPGSLDSSTRLSHVVSVIHLAGFGGTAFRSSAAPPINQYKLTIIQCLR